MKINEVLIMEEEKQVNSKKRIAIITVVIIMALLLVIGISYALWQQSKVQEGTNYIASGCFGVTFKGNNPINLSNSFPITTEDGMKTTPYTFTITSTCEERAAYNVNLETLEGTTIKNTSVRVALDSTHKLYSEYEEVDKYYNTSVESRRLISGRLESGESVTYNLRLWIDESVTIEEQNKIFASKIVVNANEDIDDPVIENINATSTINSINITYNANGDSTTCKWGTTEGTYVNAVDNATITDCNIENLTDNTTYYYQVCAKNGKGEVCKDGNIKTKPNTTPFTESDVGKYVTMTPTATSYTLPNSLSGCTGISSTCIQNTINPSELNLWRVIKVNSDGTVEMVSDKVSSTNVFFRGSAGYRNLVGGLNTIAAQYTDGKHVQSTRHMGYSNQTEKCTTLSSSACGTDTGYQTDTDLVKSAVGDLVASSSSGSVQGYFLASRYYSNDIYMNRLVDISGTVTYGLLVSLSGDSGLRVYAVRPIVTLKSESRKLSGSGTEDSPYILN